MSCSSLKHTATLPHLSATDSALERGIPTMLDTISGAKISPDKLIVIVTHVDLNALYYDIVP